MWVTAYHDEPDFQLGQDVPQEEPVTVPETVTDVATPSLALIGAPVDADARMFTPSQSGTRAWEPATGGVVVGGGAGLAVGSAGGVAEPGSGVVAAAALRTPDAA
jgi:hypothetical protein